MCVVLQSNLLKCIEFYATIIFKWRLSKQHSNVATDVSRIWWTATAANDCAISFMCAEVSSSFGFSLRTLKGPTISNYNKSNESETRICYASNYSIWQFCQLDEHIAMYTMHESHKSSTQSTNAYERHERSGFTMENFMSHDGQANKKTIIAMFVEPQERTDVLIIFIVDTCTAYFCFCFCFVHFGRRKMFYSENIKIFAGTWEEKEKSIKPMKTAKQNKKCYKFACKLIVVIHKSTFSTFRISIKSIKYIFQIEY